MIFHKNSQKRYYTESQVYFVTCNVQDKIPFFDEEIFCELWTEELRICKKLKEFELFGFCLLPNHFHLLIRPSEKFNLSEIMQFLKRHFSRNANFILGYNEGDIRECRLQDGRYKLIEKEVLSHDKKIIELKVKFLQKYKNKHNFPKFK